FVHARHADRRGTEAASPAGMNRRLTLADDDYAMLPGLRSARESNCAWAGAGGQGCRVVLRAVAETTRTGAGRHARAHPRGAESAVDIALSVQDAPGLARLFPRVRAVPAADHPSRQPRARADLVRRAAEPL